MRLKRILFKHLTPCSNKGVKKHCSNSITEVHRPLGGHKDATFVTTFIIDQPCSGQP